MKKSRKQCVILIMMLLYLITCILNIISCISYIVMVTTSSTETSYKEVILYVIFFANTTRIKLTEVLLADVIIRLLKGVRLSWSAVLVLSDGLMTVFLILLTPIVTMCNLITSNRWNRPTCNTANIIIIAALFGALGLLGVVKLTCYAILRCTRKLNKDKSVPMTHYSSIKEHRKHTARDAYYGNMECVNFDKNHKTDINEVKRRKCVCVKWFFCLYTLGLIISFYLIFWLN